MDKKVTKRDMMLDDDIINFYDVFLVMIHLRVFGMNMLVL